MLMRLQHKRPDGEVDTYHLKPGRKYYFGRGSTCEIRILDLKLSRKHCMIECANDDWQIEDLGSTNGAKFNGQPLANTRSLAVGTVIEAGTTTLTIAGFIDPTSTDDAGDESSEPKLEQLPAPEAKLNEAPSLAESTLMANDWDPQADEALVSTGALQPRGKELKAAAAKSVAPVARPALGLDDDDLPSGNTTIAPSPTFEATTPLEPRAKPAAAAKPSVDMPKPPTDTVRPAAKIKPVTIRVGKVDGDDAHPATPDLTPAAPSAVVSATPSAPTLSPPMPSKPSPAPQPVKPVVIQGSQPTQPGTDSAERSFYITVLGRRIGPLARSDARDLKSRELKGALTLADLESYPQG